MVPRWIRGDMLRHNGGTAFYQKTIPALPLRVSAYFLKNRSIRGMLKGYRTLLSSQEFAMAEDGCLLLIKQYLLENAPA
jgi:hypothetical protein